MASVVELRHNERFVLQGEAQETGEEQGLGSAAGRGRKGGTSGRRVKGELAREGARVLGSRVFSPAALS